MAGGARLREGFMQTPQGEIADNTGNPVTKQFHTPRPSGRARGRTIRREAGCRRNA